MPTAVFIPTPLVSVQYTPARFGFTGELQSQGLVYLRARWYDPSSGVFTARDPFAGINTIPNTLHPYMYAADNPVLYTDPSGKTWYLNAGDTSTLINHLTIGASDESDQALANGTSGAVTTILTESSNYFAKKYPEYFLGEGIAPTPILRLVSIAGAIWALTGAVQGYDAARIGSIGVLVTTADAAEPQPQAPYESSKGVALMYVPESSIRICGRTVFGKGTLYALNRFNGQLFALELEGRVGDRLPSSMHPGEIAISQGDAKENGFSFAVGLPISILPPN